MKRVGIFAKVFLYTTLFSAVLVGMTLSILLPQLLSYRSQIRVQSVNNLYDNEMKMNFDGDNFGEVAKLLDYRLSFQFYIAEENGNIVYASRDAYSAGITVDPMPGKDSETITIQLDPEHNLYAIRSDVLAGDYNNWIKQAVLITVAMFAACVIGSFSFARRLTNPVKMLAENTGKMARLEDVEPPTERRDEFGDLSRDVHAMYGKLKDELVRVQQLTETQRYFFTAASHELKTPIAATSVLLEGMLANVGDYSDHPKYLRECLKLADAQTKIVSEILELVNLYDGRIEPIPQTLNLAAIVAEILPDYQTVAEASGVQIASTIPENEIVIADPKILRRALANVIINAVQNTPSGGEVQIYTKGEELCVLNTGVKIPDSELKKLFDPFYRVDKARSRKDGRSGLGLTIVQKTLDTMRVAFVLENTDEGVLFRMNLLKV